MTGRKASRFVGNADDIEVVGRAIQTIDLTTPEQRELNRRHDQIMDDARSALEVTAPTDKLQQRGLMPFVKINPGKLSSRQKEIYNFQKAAAVLADYGFTCIKLQDDWNGADFLADRFRKKDDTGPGITLRVQLKGRLTIGTKYENKNIHMMFPLAGRWVLIQHEELVRIVEENADWAWKVGPVYHSGKPSAQLVAALRLYMLDAEVPATVAE